MTSQLSHRLARVERDLKANYPCPVCHGKGKWVTSTIQEGDPAPEAPPGCEGCGEAHHIIVKYVTKTKPRFDQDDTTADNPNINA